MKSKIFLLQVIAYIQKTLYVYNYIGLTSEIYKITTKIIEELK